MRRAKRILLVVLMASALPAFAQKDFLTPNEADQVREAQEPVARVKLYLLFAKQRLDQFQSIMAKNRPGRSAELRQLLEDYVSILDAVDTVTNDALVRRLDLTSVPTAIVDGEKKFLDVLQKIQAGQPRDLDMYDFALKEAIAGTSDSIDLAKEDLGDRGHVAISKVEKEKKEVAEVNAAESKLSKNPAADKAEAAAEDATKPLRKPPTLYRPGEKPGDPIPPKP